MHRHGKNMSVLKSDSIPFGIGFPPWILIWILTFLSTVHCQLEIVHDQHPHASVVKYTDVPLRLEDPWDLGKVSGTIFASSNPPEQFTWTEYTPGGKSTSQGSEKDLERDYLYKIKSREPSPSAAYHNLPALDAMREEEPLSFLNSAPVPEPLSAPVRSPRLRFQSESQIEYTPSVPLPVQSNYRSHGAQVSPKPNPSSYSYPYSKPLNNVDEDGSAPYSSSQQENENELQIHSHSHVHTRPQPPFLRYREDVRKHLSPNSNSNQIETSEEMIQNFHHHHYIHSSDSGNRPPTPTPSYKSYNSPPPSYKNYDNPPPPPPRSALPPPPSFSSSSSGRYYNMPGQGHGQGPMNMKQFRHFSPPPPRPPPPHYPLQHHHYGNNNNNNAIYPHPHHREQQRSFTRPAQQDPEVWMKYPKSRVDHVNTYAQQDEIGTGTEVEPEPKPVMVSLDPLLSPPPIKINNNYQKQQKVEITSSEQPSEDESSQLQLQSQSQSQSQLESDAPNVVYSTLYQEQFRKHHPRHQNQRQHRLQSQSQRHQYQNQRQYQQQQQQQYYNPHQNYVESPKDFDFSPSEVEQISQNFQKSCASQFPELELLRFLCQQRQRNSMSHHRRKTSFSLF